MSCSQCEKASVRIDLKTNNNKKVFHYLSFTFPLSLFVSYHSFPPFPSPTNCLLKKKQSQDGGGSEYANKTVKKTTIRIRRRMKSIMQWKKSMEKKKKKELQAANWLLAETISLFNADHFKALSSSWEIVTRTIYRRIKRLLIFAWIHNDDNSKLDRL